jgi:hypothetical protein
MRYVTALVGAAVIFLGTMLLVGFFVGRMFDGLQPPASYIPFAGTCVIALAAAVVSFRATLKRSRSMP